MSAVTTTQPTGFSYRARRLRGYVRDLWARREFAWYLAMGNLKARNASTALGLFWWVLNPLLLGLIYFFIFGVIFAGSSRPDDYIAYLLSGMFVFHFTQQSMTGGANSILQNSKLLANLKFPRMVLLISAITESLVGFLASLGVLFVITGTTLGIWPGPSIMWLLVAIPLQVLLNLGLAALVARMAVPFRDINNLIPYVTRLWLYLSPIIWSLSLLETKSLAFQRIVHLNPMFDLIALYRTALLDYPLDPSVIGIAAVWSVGVFVLGSALFVPYESRMVRYL